MTEALSAPAALLLARRRSLLVELVVARCKTDHFVVSGQVPTAGVHRLNAILVSRTE